MEIKIKFDSSRYAYCFEYGNQKIEVDIDVDLKDCENIIETCLEQFTESISRINSLWIYPLEGASRYVMFEFYNKDGEGLEIFCYDQATTDLLNFEEFKELYFSELCKLPRVSLRILFWVFLDELFTDPEEFFEPIFTKDGVWIDHNFFLAKNAKPHEIKNLAIKIHEYYESRIFNNSYDPDLVELLLEKLKDRI